METDREKEFWDCVYKKVMEFLNEQDKSADTSRSIPAGEALGYIAGYEKNGCSPEDICRFVVIQTRWDCDTLYSYGFDRQGDDILEISKDIKQIMIDTMKEMNIPDGTVYKDNSLDEYHEYVKKYGC